MPWNARINGGNGSSVYSQLSLHLLYFICFLQSSFEHHGCVYRIFRWGHHEHPQYLTIIDGNVSIAASGVADFKAQEWRVVVLENGNVAIQYPAHLRPSRSLSYEKPPEEGKRIFLGPPFDFPTCEWRIEPAPQKPLPVPFHIRVPEKDLIVVVSPIKIYPPQLRLEAPKGVSLEDAWAFEPVSSD